MSVSQETINRALLGDEEAAKECGEHDYAIPCQMCGSPRVTRDEYTCTCAECDHDAVVWVVAGEPRSVRRRAGLDAWNYRPDVRKAARQVYAPKWTACKDAMPPDQANVSGFDRKNIVVYQRGILPEVTVGFYVDGWWFLGSGGFFRQANSPDRITHWTPPPEPPDANA